MKITIVTPTYNRTTFLNQTIESVVTQKGDFELEYIIQDGGSTHDLIQLVESWKDKIENKRIQIGCRNIELKLYSEKDTGMYDAINKGFAKSTGDIMAWLNSDDMYHPYALDAVSKIFKKYKSVSWLTGIPNSYNKYGHRSGYDTFPSAYSQKYLNKGYYRLSNLSYGFNWIQQESSFWRRDLWNKVGGINTKNKYASDFYLWLSFAKYTDLVKVETFLGGYRSHEDQITANPDLYNKELPYDKKPSIALYFLRTLTNNNKFIKKLIWNKKSGFPFVNILGLKYNDLVGRKIIWSWETEDWEIYHCGIFE